MRFIKLEDLEKRELKKIYRSHPKLHVRQRAHCLLLSDAGHSVPRLSGIFFTRTHTIRAWFGRWLTDRFKGLEIRAGRGLKPTIKEDNTVFVDSIKKEVSLDPHNLKRVVEKLNNKWGTNLTVRMVKMFLKKS
jgi:transposase